MVPADSASRAGTIPKASRDRPLGTFGNEMTFAISKPSFWYLAASLSLGVTAFPSVIWLPDLVERFRFGGVGLLPFPLLFARQMGGLIAVLSIVFFALFILSAFMPKLHAAFQFKAWGLALVVVYSFYALSLLACFAIAG